MKGDSQRQPADQGQEPQGYGREQKVPLGWSSWHHFCLRYAHMRPNSTQPKAGFSSLRVRLVGVVFLAIAPALLVLFFTQLPWVGFAIGMLALVAAWFAGDRFVLRQVRELVVAVRRVGEGDF